MKRMLILSIAAILALSGCAPDTTTAYKTCMNVRSAQEGIILDPGELTEAEMERVVEITGQCLEESEADPAGFNQRWSD